MSAAVFVMAGLSAAATAASAAAVAAAAAAAAAAATTAAATAGVMVKTNGPSLFNLVYARVN